MANIYLHYCLDGWFQHVVKKHCGGEACLIRYADDFVCAFEREDDAERFYRVLGKLKTASGGKLPNFWGLSFAGGGTERGKRI